ncbi:MAG: leucine-rich repeat domain-containing protein, partial [Clostridiales bacterium]|nr:leucine-rich repeat domain-containing protein [Clostridiales bacterium]
MRKKFLSLLIAAVMVLAMVPATAWADEKELVIASFETGKLNEAVAESLEQGVSASEITSLTVESGILNADDFYYMRDNMRALVAIDLGGTTCVDNKIPDEAFMYSDNAERFERVLDVSKFVFPEDITYIGTCAFDKCVIGGDLIIPDTVETIGNSAFAQLRIADDSSSSRTLTLSENLETLNQYAFGYCDYSFTGDLVIPESVETINSWAFLYAGFDGSLTFEGNNFTTIGDSAFQGCDFKGGIIISEGVTEIKHSAFRNDFEAGWSAIVLPSTISTFGNDCFARKITTDIGVIYFTDTNNKYEELTPNTYYNNSNTVKA